MKKLGKVQEQAPKKYYVQIVYRFFFTTEEERAEWLKNGNLFTFDEKVALLSGEVVEANPDKNMLFTESQLKEVKE